MFEPNVVYKEKNKMSSLMKTKEKKLLLIKKSETNQKIYEEFNNQFKLYLDKFPKDNVFKYVEELYNKDMIYLAQGSSSKDIVLSRILSDGGKLYGIALNINNLDIELEEKDNQFIGCSINNPEDSIFAVYFSLIRYLMINDESKVLKDIDLHKLITTYLYFQVLKVINLKNIFSQKHKQSIQLAVIYIYVKSFLGFPHAKCLNYINKNFSDIIPKELFDELSPKLETVSKYKTFIDLPKVLIDMKIYTDSVNKFQLMLLKLFGQNGFFGLNSGLDYIVGMIILSKYPTDIFNKNILTTMKIHDNIEDYVLKNYYRSIKYDTTSKVLKNG